MHLHFNGSAVDPLRLEVCLKSAVVGDSSGSREFVSLDLRFQVL